MAWTQVANNAKTTLSADCTDVATAITPTAKTTFPDPEDDGSFYVTIWDADTYPDPGDDPGMEIVLVTADAAANWTVTRGQAGTAGAAHVAGDAVRLLWLAEHAQEIQDAVDLNGTHRTNVDAVAGIVLGDGAGGYTAAAATDLPAHATEHESGGGDEVDHNALQNTHNLTTDIDHNALLNTHNLTTDIDHNALLNYSADRHFLQTDIEAVDTDLATGLLKVTTGTGALSSITDSSANWDAAYSHVSASGASHSYLDQAVTIAGTPQFAKLGLGAAAGTARLTFPAATTPAGGVDFGGDVNLYRGGTNQLRTDDAIVSDIGSGTGYPLSSYCAGNGAGLFASSAADYVRVVIDAETADADAQLAFMEAGSTRWTIGNHGGGLDVFTFRSSAGEFTDVDILRLTRTGVLALEYNVTPEFSVRANKDNTWAMCSFGTNRGNRAAFIAAYGSSNSIQPDELSLKNLYGPITFYPGDAGSSSEQMSLDNSGNVVAQGYVNAVGGFKDNGVAGIDTTFVDADGNTLTVSGGIITAKTAP